MYVYQSKAHMWRFISEQRKLLILSRTVFQLPRTARNVVVELSPSTRKCLSLMHWFWVISADIATSHILLNLDALCDIFIADSRVYGSIFNHFDVTGQQSYGIR